MCLELMKMKTMVEEIRKKAKKYCEDNGLRAEKIDSQICHCFGEEWGFFQRVPYHGTGLLEDISSQPKPTLVYIVDSDTFEQTEYTEQYLKI